MDEARVDCAIRGSSSNVSKPASCAVLDRDADGELVRKAGIMAVVVASGDVRPGDGIRVYVPARPHRRPEPV